MMMGTASLNLTFVVCEETVAGLCACYFVETDGKLFDEKKAMIMTFHFLLGMPSL